LRSGSSSGFTLIELIVVIVITGIIGSMALVFLKWPVQQYMDVSRRAELSYIADSVSDRLAEDVRTAVPDSLRLAGCGATPCVEFLPGRDAGHYRALHDMSGASAVGDVLDFTNADDSFDIVGPPVNFSAGDYILIGSSTYDMTTALRAYAGVPGLQSNVAIVPTKFSSQSAAQRFDVVDGARQAVTYACEGVLGALNASGDGQASLVKHWAYGFNPEQQAPADLAGSRAIVADKVSRCAIGYANPRLLGVRLTLTSGGESVTLYKEIYMSRVR
jgi:MSHA biogenesis protein MshO